MGIRRVLKIVSLSVCGLVVFLIAGAITYERFNRYQAERDFSPQGEIVDVGEHSLHVLRKGEGGPTVIFESGLDFFGHLSWYKVQDAVSRRTTTLSYDRAGILWSEPSSEAKSAVNIAQDLSRVLSAGDYPKPYILVGHSAAGLSMRKFTELRSEDIAAVVLVDAAHPRQVDYAAPKMPPAWLMGLMNSFGVIRTTMNRQFPNTEPDDRINLLGPALVHRSVPGMFAEAGALVAMSAEVAGVTSFGEIPVIVISATAQSPYAGAATAEDLELAQLRNDLQQDLLTLSSDSRQILAPESLHYVHIDQPDLVIQAIEELLLKTVNR